MRCCIRPKIRTRTNIFSFFVPQATRPTEQIFINIMVGTNETIPGGGSGGDLRSRGSMSMSARDNPQSPYLAGDDDAGPSPQETGWLRSRATRLGGLRGLGRRKGILFALILFLILATALSGLSFEDIRRASVSCFRLAAPNFGRCWKMEVTTLHLLLILFRGFLQTFTSMIIILPASSVFCILQTYK